MADKMASGRSPLPDTRSKRPTLNAQRRTFNGRTGQSRPSSREEGSLRSGRDYGGGQALVGESDSCGSDKVASASCQCRDRIVYPFLSSWFPERRQPCYQEYNLVTRGN